jgi:phospholipid N-methyltransferase
MNNRIAFPAPARPMVGRPPHGSEIADPQESRRHDRLRFFRAFLRKPLTVGACWPSSRELAEKVVSGCDLRQRETIVELGPGTGAFTELILQRIRKRTRFFALEINPDNVGELRRRFPQLEVYAECARKLPKHLGAAEGQKADCIISGLAWGNMLPATQNRIFDAVLSSLAPGGLFTTFAYAHAAWFPTSLRFRKRLFQYFTKVETTRIIWRNLPPAFVYRCWSEG